MTANEIAQLRNEIRELRDELEVLRDVSKEQQFRHVRLARRTEDDDNVTGFQPFLFVDGNLEERQGTSRWQVQVLDDPYMLVFEQDGQWFRHGSTPGAVPTEKSACVCELIDKLEEEEAISESAASELRSRCGCTVPTDCESVVGGVLPGDVYLSVSGVTTGPKYSANTQPWMSQLLEILNGTFLFTYPIPDRNYNGDKLTGPGFASCQRGHESYVLLPQSYAAGSYEGGNIQVNGVRVSGFLDIAGPDGAAHVNARMTVEPGLLEGDPFDGGNFQYAGWPFSQQLPRDLNQENYRESSTTVNPNVPLVLTERIGILADKHTDSTNAVVTLFPASLPFPPPPQSYNRYYPCNTVTNNLLPVQTISVVGLVDNATYPQYDGWADQVNGTYEFVHRDGGANGYAKSCEPAIHIVVPDNSWENGTYPRGPLVIIVSFDGTVKLRILDSSQNSSRELVYFEDSSTPFPTSGGKFVGDSTYSTWVVNSSPDAGLTAWLGTATLTLNP